jgi:hypothetical protein
MGARLFRAHAAVRLPTAEGNYVFHSHNVLVVVYRNLSVVAAIGAAYYLD